MTEPKLDGTKGTKKNREARAHHFLPKCYLAGFTEDGTNTGRLWVTDFKRNKQWPSNPSNSAHRRDDNRLSDPNVEPLLIENAFSNIESVVAPLLKQLFNNPQDPTAEELGDLMYFIAIQFIRVPRYRPWLAGVFDSIQKDWLNKYLKTPKTWTVIRKRIDSTMSPASSYEKMLEYKRNVTDSGSYTISAENDWYLQKGFAAIHSAIIPALIKRYWGSHISSSGGFITSDNPILMDGSKNKMTGFESANIVAFPVTRRVFIYGTMKRVKAPHVSRKLIAHRNTFTMLHADEQIYSHTPDFCWLDENGNIKPIGGYFQRRKFYSPSKSGVRNNRLQRVAHEVVRGS